jgi:hypothetical protein
MKEFNVTEEWRLAVPTKQYGNFLVADLDKIANAIVKERKEAKQSLFITVAAIKTDKYKDINNTIRFCTDPINGVNYGIMIGLMNDGNVKWQSVILNEMNTYNLNFLNDAKIFAFIRMHPKVKGSPFEVEEPIFQISDPDKISAQKNARALAIEKALVTARRMKKEDILGFGRYLGIMYPADASASIVRATLTDKALTEPYEFLEKYNNKSRRFYEAIEAARVVGIITYDYEKGYRFRSIPLGFSEFDVVAKLESEPAIFDSIKTETNKRDLTGKNLIKEKETEPDENEGANLPEHEIPVTDEKPEEY